MSSLYFPTNAPYGPTWHHTGQHNMPLSENDNPTFLNNDRNRIQTSIRILRDSVITSEASQMGHDTRGTGHITDRELNFRRQMAEEALAGLKDVKEEERFRSIAQSINRRPLLTVTEARTFLGTLLPQPQGTPSSQGTHISPINHALNILSEPPTGPQHATAIAFASTLSTILEHGGDGRYITYENSTGTPCSLISISSRDGVGKNHAGFVNLDVGVRLWNEKVEGESGPVPLFPQGTEDLEGLRGNHEEQSRHFDRDGRRVEIDSQAKDARIPSPTPAEMAVMNPVTGRPIVIRPRPLKRSELVPEGSTTSPSLTSMPPAQSPGQVQMTVSHPANGIISPRSLKLSQSAPERPSTTKSSSPATPATPSSSLSPKSISPAPTTRRFPSRPLSVLSALFPPPVPETTPWADPITLPPTPEILPASLPTPSLTTATTISSVPLSLLPSPSIPATSLAVTGSSTAPHGLRSFGRWNWSAATYVPYSPHRYLHHHQQYSSGSASPLQGDTDDEDIGQDLDQNQDQDSDRRSSLSTTLVGTEEKDQDEGSENSDDEFYGESDEEEEEESGDDDERSGHGDEDEDEDEEYSDDEFADESDQESDDGQVEAEVDTQWESDLDKDENEVLSRSHCLIQ